MRDTTKTKKFLNVVFNVKRHPAYKGGHELAGFDRIHTTFSLGTTEQEMTDEFLAQEVNNTTKYGDILQVVEIEKCFEDRSPKGRFHKDNY